MMHHISRHHFNHIHAELREYDVYPGQPPLMFSLARRNGQSQKELAEQLDIKAATLTVMINRMEKNGLVRREADPADQRVSRIYMTDKGFETLQVVRETLDRLEQQAIAGLTEEEISLLRGLLHRIKHNVRSMATNHTGHDRAKRVHHNEEHNEVQHD